ncbi:M56 family metallopeptidase [Stakelama saccharophila]|uniref:M56 family metallopeptidase n=1 Tax=Stakelama saccharophila TaxID=3075605 RepID=A0ABZ0B6P6_9SPHN|nr:M56 family metallopeptidase [Stakelama sp. W311]WNO53076.1 M56 family metallopeptidase [Stakelama sp. W311]
MIAWAIETVVATTLLMLLVLAIRRPVREAMGPRFAYALWALPALRMLLPPLPESWRASARAPIATAGETIQIYLIAPISGADAAPVASGPDWASIALGLWIVGALGFIGWHAIAHGRFCQRLIRRSRRSRALAEGRVHMIETDAANGPLAFGIFRKYVAFPRDFTERYDPSERDLALAHELCHHQRGDLYANWAALAMLAFHWFNPVAWRAFRAFRADQEMACDAVVLAGRPEALRHAYGLAIVKSAHGGAVSAACHLHTINELKGRLKMLSRNRTVSRRRLAAGASGMAALMVAGLAVTASGTSAAETLRTNVEDSIGVKLDALQLPALREVTPPAEVPAPAAPAAPDAPAPLAQDDLPPPPPAPTAPVADLSVPAAPPAPTAETRTIVIKNREIAAKARAEAMASIPDIREQNCGGGGTATRRIIENRNGAGKKKIMIICSDRIEKMAQEAQAHAMQSKSMALESALAGLESAKASIRAAADLSAADRDEALAGIDEGIAEVRAEMAERDSEID